MSDPQVAALTALREATAAVDAGRRASTAGRGVPESGKPELAMAVSQLLGATVELLHTVDLDPAPTSQAGRTLHTVTEHLVTGAGLARSVGTQLSTVPQYPPTVDPALQPEG